MTDSRQKRTSESQDDFLAYRAGEVAALLKIGRSKAYELIATGQLKVIRIGRAVRVPRAALEEWLRQHTA